MNNAVLNLDAVLVEQNSNLGQLITELKNRSKLQKLGRLMNMSSHTDTYSDGHSDYGGYGDNYNDAGRTTTHQDNGCFITTATLNSKGVMDDNCYELTLARLFRDKYVAEKHPELVAEYREIAPKIVAAINKQENKLQIYDRIWEEHLCRCLTSIEDKDFETATRIYKDMVLELKKEYL